MSGVATYLLASDQAPVVYNGSPSNSRAGSIAQSQSELQLQDIDPEDGDGDGDDEYGNKIKGGVAPPLGAPKKPKKPLWVPPPTYPYNLIPGRDLMAHMAQPRPIQVASTSTAPPREPAQPVRTKSSRQKKKPKRAEGTHDDQGWDDEDESRSVDEPSRMDVDVEMEESGEHVPAEVMAILGTARQKERERQKELARVYAEQHGGQLPPSPPKPKPAKDKVPPAKPSGGKTGDGKDKTGTGSKDSKTGSKSKDSKSKSKSNKALEKVKRSDKSSSSKSKGKSGSSDSRSRSVSFSANQGVRLEGARSADVTEPEYEEEPEEEVIDTHLYCVCKTLYDDDSVMIACDHCDEWYHPKCVHLVEEDLELVDLFICPPCAEQNSQLRSTFKVACYFTTCRKPARLPLSKFCSDECGIACVMERVDQWNALENASAEVNGRSSGPEIWERIHECSAIRQAKRREGIVVIESQSFAFANGSKDGKHEEEQRMLDRYRDMLRKLRVRRADKTRAIAGTQARIALLGMAIQRCDLREFTGKCGFDSRVDMDEGEWEDWVESEDGRRTFEGPENEDDPEDEEDLARWVCHNRAKCDRHFGWQKLKVGDFELEKQVLERNLDKLLARERELEGRIDDILAVSTPLDTSMVDYMDQLAIVNGSPTHGSAERGMKLEEV